MLKILSCVILLIFSFLYVLPLAAEPPKGNGPGGAISPGKTAPGGTPAKQAPSPTKAPPASGPKHGSGGPIDYLPVIVNGTTFFYAAGMFYQRGSDGYVLVTPPLGAVVPVLPEGYMMVTVNGATYYYFNHVYYTMNPSGAYVVASDPTVPAPIPAAVPATAATAPTAASTTTVTAVTPAQQVIVTRPVPVVVRNPDSQNPVKKLGRGIFCVVFGFLEIPKNMGEISRKEGIPQAMSYGFLKGIGFFLLREVVGAVETGTFLFPLPGTLENGVRDWGYGPLMEPEWIIK